VDLVITILSITLDKMLLSNVSSINWKYPYFFVLLQKQKTILTLPTYIPNPNLFLINSQSHCTNFD